MFYDQLVKVCKASGTSPSATALSVGMSKSNVTQWKRGQSPTLSTVSKLAQKLGVPIAVLISEID